MYEEKEFLSVLETCAYLGICKKTVYKLIREKKLYALKTGKKYLIPKSKIFDLANIN